jgi:hypothetical protein
MKPRKRFRGRHKFICDVDGKEYYSEEKMIRWDGAVVARRNWHSRHPQEFIRAVKEDVSVPNPRPDQPDTFVFVEDTSIIQFDFSNEDNSQYIGTFL